MRNLTAKRRATFPAVAGPVLCCACAILFTLGCRAYRQLPQTVGQRTAEVDALMYQVDAGAPREMVPEIPTAPLTLKTPEDFDSVE